MAGFFFVATIYTQQAMKPLAALLLLCACCFAQNESHDRNQPTARIAAQCTTTSFTGNVKRGQPYVQPIGDGLTYRLAPLRQSSAGADSKASEFIGWTIEVAYLRRKG